MRLFVSRKFPFNSGATLPLKLLSVMAYILSRLLLPMPGPAQEEPHAARFTTIEAPGAGTGFGQGTLAGSINEDGQILGFYLDANNVYHGFVRHKHGASTSFDASGAGKGAFQGTLAGTIPVKIGENGSIPGFYLDSNNVSRGFVRDRHGEIVGYYCDANMVTHGFLLRFEEEEHTVGRSDD
jgi:hypothetical protein